MKIAVCVKEVLDARLPVQITSPGGEIRQTAGDTIRVMNPADRSALTIALELRDKMRGGSRVEAFSVCNPDGEEALFHCLAGGVDSAERLAPWSKPGGPLGTALALASRFQQDRFDLICCGDETLDNSSGIVGPMIAEILGWAQVTSVCRVRDSSPEKLVVVRRLEKGYREAVEASLPLVATFTAEAAHPRYVSQRLLAKACRSVIPVTPAAVNSRPVPLPIWPAGEKRVRPRARIKKRFVPDANLNAAQRIKAIMAGGSQPEVTSSSSVVEGDVEYVVEQLYRFLKHHEFV